MLEKDRMGRWVWTLIQGKQKPLLVVQLYIPVATKGRLSTYSQQYQKIQEETGIATPEVYKTYFSDLHALLDKHGNTNKIIMGDFNRTSDEEEIAYLQAKYNLRDTYADQQDAPNMNTHTQGSTRIDYILTSAELTPYIQHFEYKPFDNGIQSDHRGLYIDIQMKISQTRQGTYTQCLKANHGTKVQKYRKKLMKIVRDKNILHRLSRLEKVKYWRKKHTQKLIQIDEEITRGMLKAERAIKPQHAAPWSPQIHEQSEKCKKKNFRTITEKAEMTTLTIAEQSRTREKNSTTYGKKGKS